MKKTATKKKETLRKKQYRVIGIDPGTASCGWGILDVENPSETLVNFGVIRTSKDDDPGHRLMQIYSKLGKMLRKDKPDVLAMERLFFFRNQLTAMQVAQAQGAIMLAAHRAKIPLAIYTPAQIKQVVCDDGKATKKQMIAAIRKLFGIRRKKSHEKLGDDSADALAVAVCHARSLLVRPQGKPRKQYSKYTEAL